MKSEICAAERRGGEIGHSIIEFTLMSPWILLLFMAIFNLGFYCYAIMSVQNAARVAALRVSSDGALTVDPTIACLFVRNELRMVSNSGWNGGNTNCQNAPLKVNAELVGISDPRNPDAIAPTALVSVTLTTIPLFTIPGMAGQLTVTQKAQMRRDE